MEERWKTTGPSPTSRKRGLPVALFVLLWLAACVPGFWSVRRAPGPYDVDGFRDVAIAQGLRDGLWASDALYRGEVAWYPPLVPAATALTARVLELEMPRAYVITGLWLNAFIPLAFFACARRLLGPWPALAATCAFLFLPGRPPAWASATYSPWLFPSVAAQVPLYVGVWAWARTLDSSSIGQTIVVGILLGLTFLAHSAAAVVLGGVVVLTALLRTKELREGRRTLALAAASGAIAALIVAPFLAPIGLRYGFAVLNREPTAWVYDNAAPSVLLAGLARPSTMVLVLLLVVGVVWGRTLLTRAGRLVLVAWVAVGGACLAYGFVAERWTSLPTVVPAYHFLFSLRAAKWLIFGCGFIAAANAVGRRMSLLAVGRLPHAFQAVLVTLLALGIYPRYLGREAFTSAPRLAAVALTPDERATQTWIRRHSDRSAVFLGSDIDALHVVAPAGRYVVSVHRYFSNPYVRYEDRAAARDRMLGALRAGDRGAFDTARAQFGVTHVLVRGHQARAIVEHSADIVRQVHQAGEITVFAVR